LKRLKFSFGCVNEVEVTMPRVVAVIVPELLMVTVLPAAPPFQVISVPSDSVPVD
jgi:hypothetical protein